MTDISEARMVRDLKAKIREDSGFALHVFRTIWEAQKPEEKFACAHLGHDGRGFQEHETRRWNRFYERAEDAGWRFTPRELDQLREGMVKYAAQFRRLTKPHIDEQRRIGA